MTVLATFTLSVYYHKARAFNRPNNWGTFKFLFFGCGTEESLPRAHHMSGSYKLCVDHHPRKTKGKYILIYYLGLHSLRFMFFSIFKDKGLVQWKNSLICMSVVSHSNFYNILIVRVKFLLSLSLVLKKKNKGMNHVLRKRKERKKRYISPPFSMTSTQFDFTYTLNTRF